MTAPVRPVPARARRSATTVAARRPDSLATPWSGVQLERPPVTPVTFSDLPAPVRTDRVEPLTVRAAFVPPPR